MAFFVLRQFLVSLLFILTTTVSVDSARAETIHLSRYLDNLDTERFNDHGLIGSDQSDQPDVKLMNPNNFQQARKSISHLKSENRRFLFGPLIKTTVTNLNGNANSQDVKGNGVEENEKKEKTDTEQILGYYNSQSNAVEYDVRGKVDKVCFSIG